MAAEKLTTGRLVQILVVMAMLITAFIWRTLEYSEDQTKRECRLNAGECRVVVNGDTVNIKLENHKDKGRFLVVETALEPHLMSVLTTQGNAQLSQHNVTEEGKKRAYFYALANDDNNGSTQKLVLSIDQDQIEINF